MAFMPEDVLNKNFTATQFRRGYDEQEVDDFLDEVVVELRRLSGENDDLRGQLRACQESKGLPVTAGAVVGAEDGKQDDTAQDDTAQDDHLVVQHGAAAEAELEAQDKIAAATLAAEQAEQDAADRIAKAKADAEQAEAEAAERGKAATEAADEIARASFAVPAEAIAVAKDEGPGTAEVAGAAVSGLGSAAGVLALAQKLHEEYVSEGQTTRERLIGEGQSRHDQVIGEAEARQEELLSTGKAKHDEFLSVGEARHDALIAEATARHEQMITEARERSTGMVAEAQEKRTEVLAALSRERDLLEKKIDELRTFERDYRARLKSYLEGQLLELDQTGTDTTPVADRDGVDPGETTDDGQRDNADGDAKNGEGKNGGGKNGGTKNGFR